MKRITDRLRLACRRWRQIGVLAPVVAGACATIEPSPPAPSEGDAIVTVSRESIYLHNSRIARSFVLRNGAPRTVGVANRLTGGADLRMDGPEFVLTMDGGRRLIDADFKIQNWSHGKSAGRSAALWTTYRHAELGLAVTVRYELGGGRSFIRKTLTLTCDGPSPLVVDRIELERFKPARQATGHDGPGQPVYVGDLFWGCEYPAADNAVRDGVVSLGYLAGVVLTREPMVSRGAVVGAGFGGRIRDAFFDYIEEGHRVPRRLLMAHHTRFDLDPYNAEQARLSIDGMVRKLVREYETPFQAFVFDEGWDTNADPWIPDPSRFPEGFAPLRRAAEEHRIVLGLQVSSGRIRRAAPSGSGGAAPGCLGDPTFRRRFVERVANALRVAGVGYLRLDGFAAPCTDPTHPHRVGPYAAAAAADALLETLVEIRNVKPDVFLLLGDGCWLSPWWLIEADAVWRGDAEIGFALRPSDAPRRERWISFVDSVIHREIRLRGSQFPLHALAVGDIIHGRLGNDTPDSEGTVGERDEHVDHWRHMAVMSAGRGTRMGDLYLNYAVVTRDQWSCLAEWIRWHRRNADLLALGDMVGGDPAKEEPYAFVHVAADRAIVVARNPSDAAKGLTLRPDVDLPRFRRRRAGSWKSMYPNGTSGIQDGENAWTIWLKPFEVRVLEVKAGE
jgi:hypothetical protein